MAEERRAFLDGLKPGDEVRQIICGRYGMGRSVKTYKVERLTAAQIVMSDGTRVRRKDGLIIGEQGFRRFLEPIDPEVLAQVEREERARRLAQYFESVQWNRVPLEKLEATYAALRRTDHETADRGGADRD